MKKYIVLSVNDNPDYLYFTPLTVWAWKKMGWDVHVDITITSKVESKDFDMPTFQMASPSNIIAEIQKICYGFNSEYHCFTFTNHSHKHWEGYRSDTLSQMVRLYMGAYLGMYDECYIMTSDIDMIPLSNYWNPNEDDITIYGYDLTGYTHFPICYVGMKSSKWIEVMGLTSGDHSKDLKRDLDQMPNAKEEDFYKRWFVDQDLITKRIKETQFNKTIINRGQYKNGYAVGRVDRGSWSLDHKQFIDAHLFQQVYHKGREQYFEKTLDLLEKIWPEENFDWLILYTEKFRKLTGHK